MKRVFVLAFTFVVLFVVSVAYAEDLTNLTLEELIALRDDTLSRLTDINSEISRRTKQETETDVTLGRIIDLFPDETLAKVVRDACTKFSIEQPVTQDDLDKVTKIWMPSGKIHDLTGIGLCRNLTALGLYGCYEGETLPDELQNCTELTNISLGGNKSLVEIPAFIGNFEKLTRFGAPFTSIKSLPDSIGNLKKLKYLELQYTDLASLPDTIGNCTSLKELDISHTQIDHLPDSIYTLELESINMDGTNIR